MDSISSKWMEEAFKELGLERANVAHTPAMDRNMADMLDEDVLNDDEHALFRRVMGRMMDASQDRPDTQFATKVLARVAHDPRVSDHPALTRLVTDCYSDTGGLQGYRGQAGCHPEQQQGGCRQGRS